MLPGDPGRYQGVWTVPGTMSDSEVTDSPNSPVDTDDGCSTPFAHVDWYADQFSADTLL